MKKILIIGASPLNFTVEIIINLLKNGHKVTIFTYGEYSFPTLSKEHLSGLDIKLIQAPPSSDYFKRISILVSGFLQNFSLIIKYIYKGNIKTVKELYNYCRIGRYSKELKSFDVINFQQLSLYAIWLPYLNKNTRVISSFWGSDLFMKDSCDTLLNKKEFLERANTITVQNKEMKEFVLKKYGTHFSSKIELLLFPIKNLTFKYIDELKDINTSKKINIAIGYNANKRQNHSKVLDEMQKLSKVYLDKINLIFFMHYGEDERYKNKLLTKTRALNISYEVVEKRLLENELASIRKASDIMIMMPVSDAFSASLSEVLYSENIVIVGNWLPYSRYKENKVYYEEIESFKDLSEKLKYVIDNYQMLKNKAIGNREKIIATLDYDGNLIKWIKILTL